MEISVILPHVEALIFASEKPLTSLELTELINNALGFLDDKITLDQIESAVQGVIEKYDSDFYPFEIRESGGGWQFLTKKDYHKTVAQLNGDKFLKRLSAASLESLAIIAYKQPITKGEVESIRGVNSDYSIQKLLDKELIVITGRNEDLPGKPLVYATSKHFMDYFGINSSDELPMIKEILSSQPFLPTPVPQPNAEGLFKDSPVDEERVEDNDPLVVRANGELIEEPRVVVDGITEVVEPEQVIENDEADEETSGETGNVSSEKQDIPGDEDSQSTEDDAREDANEDEEELIVADLNEQLEESDDSGNESPQTENNIANESFLQLDESEVPGRMDDESPEDHEDDEDPNGEFSEEVGAGAEEDDFANTSEDPQADEPDSDSKVEMDDSEAGMEESDSVPDEEIDEPEEIPDTETGEPGEDENGEEKDSKKDSPDQS